MAGQSTDFVIYEIEVWEPTKVEKFFNRIIYFNTLKTINRHYYWYNFIVICCCMIKKKVFILCSKYGEPFGPLKCNFLNSVSLKYSAFKLNNPIYFKQTVYFKLCYLQVNTFAPRISDALAFNFCKMDHVQVLEQTHSWWHRK